MLLLRKGSVEAAGLKSRWAPKSRPQPFSQEEFRAGEPEISRQEALSTVIDNTPEDGSVVIGTTGFTGRELFAISDRPNHLYMVGSMGCASSFGLGLSLALPETRVLVADGDGAALMRMGNLATVGAYGEDNFRHLVLDNGVHESTGGQSTVSPGVSFAAVARACGYPRADEALTAAELETFLRGRQGPSLLHLKTKRGVPEGLPRPNVTPREVKQRLMRHINAEAPWKDL